MNLSRYVNSKNGLGLGTLWTTLWWVELSRSSAHALGAVTVKPQVDDMIVMIMITWHNITTTRIVPNIFFSFNIKV